MRFGAPQQLLIAHRTPGMVGRLATASERTNEAGRASTLPAYIEHYNWDRPHSACGGLPPMSRIVGVNNLSTRSSLGPSHILHLPSLIERRLGAQIDMLSTARPVYRFGDMLNPQGLQVTRHDRQAPNQSENRSETYCPSLPLRLILSRKTPAANSRTPAAATPATKVPELSPVLGRAEDPPSLLGPGP